MADERGAREVVSATVDLRRLVRGRRLDPGLEGIDIHIEEHPQEPGVAYCTVKIDGDTKADRDAIKKMFTDKGWTCKNDAKDETKATCTS
jgi:hypothetical protein